ncbi:hypothetical protein J6590_027123 [Homalodisca vitripennis]|nr:hypothetical protein J6590_027123 [Homalodisca vitripennis]
MSTSQSSCSEHVTTRSGPFTPRVRRAPATYLLRQIDLSGLLPSSEALAINLPLDGRTETDICRERVSPNGLECENHFFIRITSFLNCVSFERSP